MKTVEELIGGHREYSPPVSGATGLVDLSILAELQLLDCRVLALRDRLALLFDTRNALVVEEGNCALVVGSGVRSLSWSRDVPREGFTALPYMGGQVLTDGPRTVFELSFTSLTELHFSVERAEFLVLRGIGIPDVPPDYGEAEVPEISAGVPSWGTRCEVLSVHSWVG